MLKLKIFKKNNSAKTELSQRINRMLNDEEFRAHCYRLKSTPDFEENFALVEKIAKIDIDNIRCNMSLIENQQLFTADTLIEFGHDFYRDLDKIAPSNFSFEELFLQNLKYLVVENNPNGPRSFCEARKTNHDEMRKIYVNIENRITDAEVLMHEFGHSFSKCFTNFAQIKDRKISEVPTVIIDQLSSLYLIKRMPHLKENFIENDIFRQVLNVKKARESLLDGLIVKIMTNEISFSDAVKKYGNLFKQYPYMLDSALHRIETYNFNDIMFESKYLIPQMISLEMRECFLNSPTSVAQDLKTLIQNEYLWTLDEAIQYLNLGTKEKLVDNYVNKFNERISSLRQKCKKDEKYTNKNNNMGFIQ